MAAFPAGYTGTFFPGDTIGGKVQGGAVSGGGVGGGGGGSWGSDPLPAPNPSGSYVSTPGSAFVPTQPTQQQVPPPSGGGGGNSNIIGDDSARKAGYKDFSDYQLQQALKNASQAQAPQPVQSPIDYNAIFDPLLQNLAENNPIIQSAYDQSVGNINASKATRLGENSQAITQQEGDISQAKGAQDVAAQNAQDEARRQFAEIQQGLQARYGGTTGTGQFASELAGRQTLQNLANTRQQHSQAILQLDNKLQQVHAVGALAVQDIEDKTKSALDQAKQQLDQQLQSVRDRQGEVLSQKAQMAAQAIRDYQGRVDAVNAQNAAFKQNIVMQQQAAANQIAAIQEQIKAQAQYYANQGQSLIGSIPTTGNTYTTQTQTTPAGGVQGINTGTQLVGGAGALDKNQLVGGAGTVNSTSNPLDYLKNLFGQ